MHMENSLPGYRALDHEYQPRLHVSGTLKCVCTQFIVILYTKLSNYESENIDVNVGRKCCTQGMLVY